MLDENAFSLDSFDDRSWLFLLDVPATQTWNAWGKSWGKSWGVAWGPLLEAPYFDLSGRQQVQIRSALASVYAETEVDQVFVVAAQNNLCVLDAITALRISVEPLQVVVAAAKQRKAVKQVATTATTRTEVRQLSRKVTAQVAYVGNVRPVAYAATDTVSIYAPSVSASVTALDTHANTIIFSTQHNTITL